MTPNSLAHKSGCAPTAPSASWPDGSARADRAVGRRGARRRCPRHLPARLGRARRAQAGQRRRHPGRGPTELARPERQALVDGLLPISGSRAGARSIELTVVVQPEVRPWRYPPTGDFLYGDWLRDDFEADGPPQPAAQAGPGHHHRVDAGRRPPAAGSATGRAARPRTAGRPGPGQRRWHPRAAGRPARRHPQRRADASPASGPRWPPARSGPRTPPPTGRWPSYRPSTDRCSSTPGSSTSPGATATRRGATTCWRR